MELANFFWERCQDRLFLAVFASCITRRIAETLPASEDNVKWRIHNYANEYETAAIEMLTKCTMIYPVSFYLRHRDSHFVLSVQLNFP